MRIDWTNLTRNCFGTLKKAAPWAANSFYFTIHDDVGMQYLGETSPNVFTFRLVPAATDVNWVKVFVSDRCRINIHVTAIEIIVASKEVVLRFYSNTDPKKNPDLHSLAKVKEISVGRELKSILVLSFYYWDD